MTKKPYQPAPFPSRQEILDFIARQPGSMGKREIARAFKLDAGQKIRLKRILRELKDEGLLGQERGKRLRPSGSLPDVSVLDVTGTDSDGELLARPVKWNDETDGPPPPVFVVPDKRRGPAPGIGDRVLARLSKAGDGAYEARVIRRLSEAPARVLGVFSDMGPQGRIRPVDRKNAKEMIVAPENRLDAKEGELVLAQILPGRPFGLRAAKVVECLGARAGARSATQIAIYSRGIPVDFPPEAIQQAEAAGPAELGSRTDLRDIPLVTIDGADARDFDDAVWAEPAEEGGWHLLVAIADVAWYVRPNDALDRAAKERGNSVYFPDRAIHMLPEALSAGWCSLRPHEERPCLAVHLWIDAKGHLHRHKFVRGLMRSAARLTYEQLQAARDGQPDETTAPLMDKVVAPLYGAYEAFLKDRENRGVLELDLPERRVVLDDSGEVARVERRQRFDSHKLIEEFMICANVAAAETLERQGQPCMYRVHDEPTREKVETLRQFLETLKINLPKGGVTRPAQFNGLMKRVADTPYAHMVSEVVLRSQAQAEYSPDNYGHFGLALRRYCHFTSPIRRYADLLVHRALIRSLRPSAGSLPKDPGDFKQIGKHISDTERRASAAERDAVDRYMAAFMADKVGATFAARVNGVTRFGLFVTLDDSGADGLIPISTLPDDYYDHVEEQHLLLGRSTGRTFRLGEPLEVRLTEADPVSGGLVMELCEHWEPPAWIKDLGGHPRVTRARPGGSHRKGDPKGNYKGKSRGKPNRGGKKPGKKPNRVGKHRQ
ncbi:ribonuclease R [Magnetospira sp. QH-2]|uniref:ribonuclease R n=1 Tax=Magnetospira sp. (strain QH-2) TaxID=1288970 RepID=UPI0003E8194E|nr:ribonuclease R [Magnetospira sp. QH-2]CCQ75160.1 ribonuclease R [Magnetospira sp. QH-2]